MRWCSEDSACTFVVFLFTSLFLARWVLFSSFKIIAHKTVLVSVHLGIGLISHYPGIWIAISNPFAIWTFWIGINASMRSKWEAKFTFSNGIVCACVFFIDFSQNFYCKCYIIRMFLAVNHFFLFCFSLSFSVIKRMESDHVKWPLVVIASHIRLFFTATRYTHEPFSSERTKRNASDAQSQSVLTNSRAQRKIQNSTPFRCHVNTFWCQIGALDKSAKTWFVLAHLCCASQPCTFFLSLSSFHIMFMSIIFIVFRFIFLRLLHVLWLSNLFVLCTLFVPVKQWWKTENNKYTDAYNVAVSLVELFFSLLFISLSHHKTATATKKKIANRPTNVQNEEIDYA